jgi:hypothetical protein
MIEIELDLGDLSDYDDETLASANKAFFLCEEEREYDAAEPFLKFAAERRHSYSMIQYALLILSNKTKRSREEILHACDLIIAAAVRGQEGANEYLQTNIDICIVADIRGTLDSMSKENLARWLRGKRVADKEDARRLRYAQHLLYDYCTRKEKPIDSGVDTE